MALHSGGSSLSGRRSKLKVSKQVDTLHEAPVMFRERHHSLDKSIRDPTTGDEGLSRSDGLIASISFRKHNAQFHKLFEDIPEAELLTETFTCSLQKEVLYHGKLFVSEEHICFHSSVLLKDTKVVISTSSVCDVKRHKTPLPMLSILTVDGAKMSGTSSFEESINSRNNSFSHPPSDKGISLSQRVADNTMSRPSRPKRADGTVSLIFFMFCLLLLLLLLISGYIGLRIVALEEKLTNLGDNSL
ncbi:hypothetical protein NHX12_003858 [Muraenolepis orangiensis]|uniref:GRAM domain-containing protein n=1 Tax=Muraenolepis orangiensis TaxID=630683 RepID=A0A9Q0IF13_9TELE|nr:hypothetical protein NHX12_003858 [Muraenolepis orangiensis]